MTKKKKIINIDVLQQGWMQVYPTVYYAILNGYAERINEETEFVYKTRPKNVDALIENITRIVKDEKWQWPNDRVPYEILVKVPHDSTWVGTIDAGPQWKNKKRVDQILATDNSLKGRIDKLSLRPTFDHSGIDKWGYVDAQPHLVLAFTDDEDFVYWRMKYE